MSTKATPPPPAYFLSLSLENVRSFGEKQTISFLNKDGNIAQWTIILSDNGAGKTTVLKSIAAVMPAPDPGLPGVFVPTYLVNWPYTWTPVRHDGEKKSEIKYETGVGKYINNIWGRGEFKRKWEQSLTVERIDNETNKFKRSGYALLDDVETLICYGYGASRSVGNSQLSTNETNNVKCQSLFDDRADLLNPEEWFMQLDYNSYKGKDKARAVIMISRVYTALLEVLPDVEEIRIHVTDDYQQQLEFKTPYGWVRLRDMSLGYQTLVVWLTDFASKLFIRYPDSPNPLEEPAIVLIDEIDLHLHPSWQRKLIGFLSGIFKNTQFIATAHSPLVVQAAGDKGANVVLLKREGDQTIVHQGADLPDVRRWRVDQILSSELFEDASPLSPQTEKDLQRRNELLLKKRLTAKDKAELERLTQELTNQPIGTTRAERRAEDLLAQLARNLGEGDLLP